MSIILWCSFLVAHPIWVWVASHVAAAYSGLLLWIVLLFKKKKVHIKGKPCSCEYPLWCLVLVGVRLHIVQYWSDWQPTMPIEVFWWVVCTLTAPATSVMILYCTAHVEIHPLDCAHAPKGQLLRCFFDWLKVMYSHQLYVKWSIHAKSVCGLNYEDCYFICKKKKLSLNLKTGWSFHIVWCSSNLINDFCC